MGFLLWLRWAMHCVRIGLVVTRLPNYLAADCKCVVGIVLAIDSFFLIVHPFEGDMPLTRSVSFRSSNRSVS